MQITVKSRPAAITTLVVAVVVFILLAVWVGKIYLASVFAERPTVASYQTAVRLDPGNSEYALSLGRLYEYTVADANPELALAKLRRAAQLNPYNAQAWLDLATALQFQGENTEAEECMRWADNLVPRSPNFQWAIGNFFLLHNEVAEAFRHFKAVLAGNPDYGPQIYNIAWKASSDGKTILAEVIPNEPGHNISYMNYLLSTHRLSETPAVWNRIAADQGKFPANFLAYYLDVLISSGQPDQAYKVWMTLREKGLIPSTDESTPKNLIENGDFENPLLGFGFGWRVAGVNGVYVGLDDNTYHSATQSLLIQFPGAQNVDYHNVFQYVPVLPSRHYRLSAFMKTTGITTDSGPRIEVRDAYDPARLDKYSDQFTGTTPSWTLLSFDFETAPKTNLVIVAVARVASQLFGGQIAGRVWVDDVTLTPQAK